MPAPTEAARPTRNVSQVCGSRTRRRTAAPASTPSRPSARRGPAARIAARTCAARSRPLRARALGVQIFLPSLLGEVLVLVFGLGELDQQFAHRCVARAFRRPCGRSAPPPTPSRGVFAHLVELERPRQPERLALMKPLTSWRRISGRYSPNFCAIEIEQHAAMADLLLRHLVEHLGGGRKLLAQPVREAAVDAAVFFLVGDGEREDFLFGEVGKAASRRPPAAAGYHFRIILNKKTRFGKHHADESRNRCLAMTRTHE